jgi:hypothetical protein
MGQSRQKLALVLFAAVSVFPPLMAGCRDQETVVYNQWEHETHRPHVDLNRRTAAEQKEYRDWRDHQPERH